MRVGHLLCFAFSMSLGITAFAASDGRDVRPKDFETTVFVGEDGLVRRYNSSFRIQAEGRIHRRGVCGANLSWDSHSLLITVADEGSFVVYSLQDMGVKKDEVVHLPEGRSWLGFGHLPTVVLPLAHHQVYVRDESYPGLLELGRRRPTLHIDLRSGEGKVLKDVGLGPLSECRIMPTGDRFAHVRSGAAALVDGMSGDILGEVRIPEYRGSVAVEPETGTIFPLGYEFDWEKEFFDFWWVSMAPENPGELEHFTVSLETGKMVKEDSISPWPELPVFDRFQFADSRLAEILADYIYRFYLAGGYTPLLTLQTAHVFARLYTHPTLLAQLPSEELFRTFLTPEGRLLIVAYPVWPDRRSLHSRVVALNTETGGIEADFIFEDILNGVFFPQLLRDPSEND